MKDFAKLVEGCRTIHNFEPSALKEEDIREALNLSLAAPNHKFTFPWKYIWPGPKQKEELAELAVDLKTSGGEVEATVVQAIKAKILNPEVIVFCQKVSSDAFQSKEDYATMSCSVQLFALALAEKNLGYKWSTGKLIRDPRTYKLLEIDPAQHEIIGFIMVGKASKSPGPKNRPTLSEVLVRGV